jgi:aquaporin related protein
VEYQLARFICASDTDKTSPSSPAITVALWLTGVLTTFRAVLLFAAQLLGGIIASALLFALTPGASSGDAAAAVDVVNTTVSNQISYQQALILEMLGTSSLVFSVLMLAVEKVSPSLKT